MYEGKRRCSGGCQLTTSRMTCLRIKIIFVFCRLGLFFRGHMCLSTDPLPLSENSEAVSKDWNTPSSVIRHQASLIRLRTVNYQSLATPKFVGIVLEEGFHLGPCTSGRDTTSDSLFRLWPPVLETRVRPYGPEVAEPAP